LTPGGLAICVFCSSSNAVPRAYFDVAEELGAVMAARGHTLVYGGASIGLMGALARAVHRGGGRVVGVLPEPLKAREIAYEQADELVITRDLRERKAIMEERADAFVALPGGFGTLEETVEILTLKQLGLHEKPICWLDAGGYYAGLRALFERMYGEGFAHTGHAELSRFAEDVPSALAYVEGYVHREVGDKFWWR